MEPAPLDTARRTVTSKPSELLRPTLGWDEAALVVRRASEAWEGGAGPWCAALSGELSDE